jgi:hypothetical protein
MPMTADRSNPDRPTQSLGKEPTPMFIHDRVLFALVQERQERERADAAHRRRVGDHPDRSFRRRLGESLMRVGSRLAADPASEPAWSR